MQNQRGTHFFLKNPDSPGQRKLLKIPSSSTTIEFRVEVARAGSPDLRQAFRLFLSGRIIYQDREIAGSIVSDGQIGLAVEIEIGHCDGPRIAPGAEVHGS
jgi:hypothetical protein